MTLRAIKDVEDRLARLPTPVTLEAMRDAFREAAEGGWTYGHTNVNLNQNLRDGENRNTALSQELEQFRNQIHALTVEMKELKERPTKPEDMLSQSNQVVSKLKEDLKPANTYMRKDVGTQTHLCSQGYSVASSFEGEARMSSK